MGDTKTPRPEADGMDPFRARMYRLIFALAAAYNMAFGLWAALSPYSFFHLFDLEAPRYPSIWSCLGMVVGLYVATYAYAAMRLERAKPLIAIGLVSKLLGPAGWVVAVAAWGRDSRRRRTFSESHPRARVFRNRDRI